MKMQNIELDNWVYACIARLTDNFDWAGQDIEFEDRCQFEQLLIDAIISNKELADKFVDLCLDHGIVEHDYFDTLEENYE
jgi:hypothetical protein